VTVGAGFAVSFGRARHELEIRAGDQSLAIARTVAASPDIIDAFATPDPPKLINPIAEAIQRTNGAAFVVVVNRDGIRYSHPNAAMIGICERAVLVKCCLALGEAFSGRQAGLCLRAGLIAGARRQGAGVNVERPQAVRPRTNDVDAGDGWRTLA
jgi:hypothetical protein